MSTVRSTVRYIGDEPREISILPAGFLKLVQPDETFEVPEQHLESYWCQPHFYETPGYDGPDEPETEEKPKAAGEPTGATVTEKTAKKASN